MDLILHVKLRELPLGLECLSIGLCRNAHVKIRLYGQISIGQDLKREENILGRQPP